MHKDDDPSAPLIVLVGIVGALLLFVAIVLLQAYFYRAEEGERQRKVEAVASDELAQLRAEQLEALSSYRWIDERAGVVAIPIDRAIELMAREASAATAPARPPG